MWFRYVVALGLILIGIAFVLMILGGCSGLKVEGGCTYERTVKTSYICQPDGQLEHYRVAPGGPEP